MTQLLAPAPFAQFQTLGGSYTADAKGVIAAAAIDDVSDLIRGGCTLLPAYHNLLATTDPGPSNDNTQDYSVSSRWVNIAAGRVWTCLSATTSPLLAMTTERASRRWFSTFAALASRRYSWKVLT